jgi:F-type H+-transporting ATPase subunit alpha
MMDGSDFLDHWLDRARAQVAAANPTPRLEETGRVESIADGVAFLSGLPNVRLEELVAFPGKVIGFVQTLESEEVGCVLLDDSDGLEAGDLARGTGEVVRVPVGEALLGRIVDPLGRPLDGAGPIDAAEHLPIERPAPTIIDRAPVEQPVQTGTLAVDTLFALGRGQRELVIGDRATGKTSLVTDCIISQKHSDMICVYVAIGQKSSSVKRAIDAIRRFGAPERCIFVVAPAAAAPGLQWIAPFAGFTMAEYFRDRGQHALVIIDDLTKHAATHRELSLLMRQPPGREAFPGDVFYVHARLLERATRLCSEKGSGSLTALPVAETDAGNLSGYIPTNLISITDGQIVLDSKLFQQGQKPAVDVGKSVSRVGGKAQAPALRHVASALRLDYAQFLELEIFTRFGGMSDERVKKQIAHGARIRSILEQPQYAPYRLAVEVALVLALQEGVLDALPLEKTRDFCAGATQWLESHAAEELATIEASSELHEEVRERLLKLLNAYATTLMPVAS